MVKIDKRRRTHCIVCEKEFPKLSRRGRKRKRMITCSPECSKAFTRIRFYALSPYARKIKKIKSR